MKIAPRFVALCLALVCPFAPLGASEPVPAESAAGPETALESPLLTELALGNVEGENASWWNEYGDCEVVCLSGSVWQGIVTYQQCCSLTCPDGYPPPYTVYYPYQGVTQICGI